MWAIEGDTTLARSPFKVRWVTTCTHFRVSPLEAEAEDDSFRRLRYVYETPTADQTVSEPADVDIPMLIDLARRVRLRGRSHGDCSVEIAELALRKADCLGLIGSKERSILRMRPECEPTTRDASPRCAKVLEPEGSVGLSGPRV